MACLPADLWKHYISHCLTPYERCLHSRVSKEFYEAFSMKTNNAQDVKIEAKYVNFVEYIPYLNELLGPYCRNNQNHQLAFVPKHSFNELSFHSTVFDELLSLYPKKIRVYNICYIDTDSDDSDDDSHTYTNSNDNITYNSPNTNRQKYDTKFTCRYYNILFFVIHYNIYQKINNYLRKVFVEKQQNSKIQIYSNKFNYINNCNNKHNNNYNGINIPLLIENLCGIDYINFERNDNENGIILNHFVKNMIEYSFKFNYKCAIAINFQNNCNMIENSVICRGIITTLRKINLYKTNITDQDLMIFLKTIEKTYKYLLSLKKYQILDVDQTLFENVYACALSKLEILDFSFNDMITDKCMEYLFVDVIFNYLVNLQKIDLSGCNLTIEILIVLNKYLEKYYQSLLAYEKKLQQNKFKLKLNLNFDEKNLQQRLFLSTCPDLKEVSLLQIDCLMFCQDSQDLQFEAVLKRKTMIVTEIAQKLQQLFPYYVFRFYVKL